MARADESARLVSNKWQRRLDASICGKLAFADNVGVLYLTGEFTVGRSSKKAPGRVALENPETDVLAMLADPDAPIQARVSIEVAEGTPAYYANCIEIGHTKWDFTLIASRLPAKPSSPKIAEMQATGVLSLPADVTINFPPNVIPGLIRALIAQKEIFEKSTGIELKESLNEQVVPPKRA